MLIWYGDESRKNRLYNIWLNPKYQKFAKY